MQICYVISSFFILFSTLISVLLCQFCSVLYVLFIQFFIVRLYRRPMLHIHFLLLSLLEPIPAGSMQYKHCTLTTIHLFLIILLEFLFVFIIVWFEFIWFVMLSDPDLMFRCGNSLLNGFWHTMHLFSELCLSLLFYINLNHQLTF